MDFFNILFLAFLPMFFAVNALGISPVYISLTSGMGQVDKRELTRSAALVAFVVALVFLFLGKGIFKAFGITPDDFKIGGGIVLMLIGISDLVFSQSKKIRSPSKELGIVPLGIPLILGPGSLTTILMLSDSYGLLPTLVSITVNIILAWLIFTYSHLITRILGKGGTAAFGKITSLFLVAIAVRLMRSGVTNLIQQASE